MTTPTFNRFKSTTIYGDFNNIDHTDSSGAILTSASGYFQRNLTISGNLTSSGIINGNKLYYNNIDISSTFVSNTTLNTRLTNYASLGPGVATFYGELYALTSLTNDNSKKVATTQFVNNLLSAVLPGYGRIDGATFTGPLRCVTQTATDNTTLVATTAFVKNQNYLSSASLSNYALLSGCTFTGNVSGITQLNTDNSTKFATTQYVKNQNYISSNPDLSPYALLSGATFTGTCNFNNGFTTPAGKDVFISCNNTFPTTNSGAKQGVGFYWNQSGSRGEVNLLTYGQLGTGGLNIWCSNSTTVPSKIVEFYPDMCTFYNDVTINETLNVKHTINILPKEPGQPPILQYSDDIGQARALIYVSAISNVMRFAILSQYGVIGYEWENGSNGTKMMKLDLNGNLTTKGNIILDNDTYISTIQLSGINLNIVPPTGGSTFIQSGLTLAGDGILNCTSINCSSINSSGTIKSTGIKDSTNSTGTSGQLPTANGSGSWVWASPTTSQTSIYGTQQILK